LICIFVTVPFDIYQNPELLLREFTHDEQATTTSPSSMFKSSFAKEVVQNVRRSMSSVNQDSLGSFRVQQQHQNINMNSINSSGAGGGGRGSSVGRADSTRRPRSVREDNFNQFMSLQLAPCCTTLAAYVG
jgi:hypothetical protein